MSNGFVAVALRHVTEKLTERNRSEARDRKANGAELLCFCSSVARRVNESWFGQNPNPQANSVLWNAMVHPLLNMTIKGAVWYQGMYSVLRVSADNSSTFVLI